MPTQKKQPFGKLLDVLLDPETNLPAGYVVRLSDLDQADLQALVAAWPKIPAWRRIAMMEDVQDIGDSDYTLSFEALARFGLGDSEPRVRELALQALWDYELSDLIPTFIQMLKNDPSVEARAAAATALGQYIYLGEIEVLAPKILKKVENTLIDVTNGEDAALVRRRALEALGFSSREEVKDMLLKAYHSGSKDWLVSALFAMGRSANKSWNSLVTQMLQNDNAEILAEAIRAAGELEIKETVPALLELLENEDRDVHLAAIWSLSQTGGEGVQEILEELFEESEDPEELELLEAALDNLAFTEDMELFDLMDLPEDDEVDEDLLNDYEDDRDRLN